MSRWGSSLWRGLALSTSTSVVALLAAGAFNDALAGNAAQQLSTAGLGAAARAIQSPTTGSPTASAAVQAQIALSVGNLARAAQALKSMAARQAAASALNVLSNPGNPLSGLVPDTTTQWINANAPTISGSTETVQQTAANAVLTWTKFNLYTGETLVFDQRGKANWTVLNRVNDTAPSQIFGAIKAPGSVYVINRNGILFGGSAQINVHSLIASSLDIGAPTMSLDQRNNFFLNQGIIDTSDNNNNQSDHTIDFSYRTDDTINNPDGTVKGDITVALGASINASQNSDGGGFVYLFGPNVANAGMISTPAGETLMVAAQQISLTPNTYTPNTPNSSGISAISIRGVGVQFSTNPLNASSLQDSRWRTDGDLADEITVPGQVTNTGLINADQGTVILNGDYVWQGGVIQANTGTGRNGAVFLDSQLQTTLAAASSTLSLPSEDGTTIALRAITSFVPGSIEVSGNTIDLEGQIEAPGASVTVTGTPAPGGSNYPRTLTVTVRDPTHALTNPLTEDGLTFQPLLSDNKTPNPKFFIEARAFPRIDVGSGAVIDASGLDGVTRSVADNFVTVKPFGNEFADQPVQRNGALQGMPLTFDVRQSTALIDVADAAGNVQQNIDELLTGGGTVKLSALQNTGGEVILQQGSVVNVSGGYTQYTGATVSSTNLVTSDGRIVNIDAASPLDTYVGVAGVVTVDHPKWNVSQTFVVPLLAGSTHVEPGYVEGRDAGGLSITSSARIVDSTIVAGVVAGERQKAQGQISSFHSTNSDDLRPVQLQLSIGSAPGQYNPYAMPSAGYLAVMGSTQLGDNVVIAPDVAAQTDASFTVNTPLPGVSGTDIMSAPTQLSASALAGLGQVSIDVSKSGGTIQVAAGTDLKVHPGGIIKLTGSSIAIFGDLTARAGQIIAEATDTVAGSSLVVSAQSVLDASGLWVNDSGLGLGDITGGAYINGGKITLLTDNWTTIDTVHSTPTNTVTVDQTGNIIFNAIAAADGSTQHAVLDVSSGGRITQNGGFQLGANGTPAGNGGNVTIETYANATYTISSATPGSTALVLTAAPPVATIEVRSTDAQGNVTNDASLPDGYVEAFGFAKGGSFTAQAAGIQIGGTHTPGTQNGTFYLPSSFFAGGGFSSYNLTAWASGLAVESDKAQGSVLRLEQRNYVADPALINVATGARLSAFAVLDYLPDIIRAPVNLTLSAYREPYPFAIGGGKAPPQADVANLYPTLDRQPDLLIDSGVQILADPLASIGIKIAGRGQLTPQNGTDLQLNVPAQTGLALILGDISTPGGAINVMQAIGSNTGQAQAGNVEVWLGSQSKLDVSGAAIVDTRQSLFRAGQVIAGGTVTVNLYDTQSALVAQPGALIDVSGASANFDILQPGSGGVPLATTHRAPTKVWSDAGSIALYAPTLLFDGTYRAQPGDPRGNGGSLTLATIGLKPDKTNSELDIQQSGPILPAGLAPDAAIAQTIVGHGYLMADQLAGSGIQNLTLSPTTNITSGAAAFANGDDPTNALAANYAPGNVVFTGSTTLAVSGNLQIDAAQIQLGNSGIQSGINVTLQGNYVALRNAKTSAPLAATGNNALTVRGNTIDIAGAVLSQVKTANFVAQGDIRLRIPYAVAAAASSSAGFVGELYAPGDLNLTAAQIYPVSDVDFTLKAAGAITIASSGNAAVAPLSAGGSVTVDGATIDQRGTLLVPLGTIRLGAQTASDLSPNDPTGAILTTSVTLEPGSMTSVSLQGMTVPFGETTDGKNWTYDTHPDSANNLVNVSQITLPTKEIELSAPSVQVKSNATVDLSGGGDVVASEFVPGTGGSNDLLTNNFNRPGTTFNPNVYAIIPGYNPAVAPVDYDLVFAQGNAVPAIGRSVFLSGGNGLPAGYYTLLPARYAVLPGAYRVTTVANAQDALAVNNRVLQDGTVQMAGYFAQPGLGTRDSRSTLFDVQNTTTWRAYSEIDQSSGNGYFAAQAARAGTVTPRLPVDAGHFIANVATALDLSGQFLMGAAPGGRGAQIDIVAQQLQILGANQSAAAGIVGIKASQLTALGGATLMLGGFHATDDSGNDIVVPVATKIEISNDAATPLEASELILVDASGANNAIQLDSGSVIGTSGVAADDGLTSVTIGGTVKKQTVSGDGALLAVSNGAPLTVTRANRSATPTGAITVKAGATITGNALTLDATGSISLAEAASFSATNIALGTQNINIGTATSASGFAVAANSNVLTQLEAAQNLTLRATGNVDATGNAIAGSINFYAGAPVGIALTPNTGSHLTLDAPTIAALDANGKTTATVNTVTLSADTIDLINSSGAAGTAGTAQVASLQVNAGAITLGNRNTAPPSQAQALGNFTAVTFNAGQQIAMRGVAAADANGANTLIDAGAAALTFTTPRVLVGAGARGAITTTGAVTLAAAIGTVVGTPVTAAELSGTLSITGSSISDNTLIQANSGEVDLHATGTANGDVTLGSNAVIDVAGYAQTFFDQIRISGGGIVQLTSDNGNLTAVAGALIDVSSPTNLAAAKLPANYAPIYAGQVVLNAANGNLNFNPNGVNAKGDLDTDPSHRVVLDPSIFANPVVGDGGGRLIINAKTLAYGDVAVPSLFSDTVDIHTASGSLSVAAKTSLVARNVNLTADTGTVDVAGTIDASGKVAAENGGTISLYGRAVTLDSNANLLATAFDYANPNNPNSTLNGGTIILGTAGATTPNGTGALLNADGSEQFMPAKGGSINVSAGATLDVSSGRKGVGGTVHLRAPLTTANSVNVTFGSNSSIVGASDVTVEAFKVWSANDSGSGFNGVIDPATNTSFFGAGGTLVNFVEGFSPANAGGLNSIDAGGSVNLQPGIELDSNGDITVKNSWNLGAGVAGFLVNATSFTAGGATIAAGTVVTDAQGNLLPAYKSYAGQPLDYAPGTSQITKLYYRTGGGSVTGEAPALTIRAGGNLSVNASITDGFFETQNRLDPTYLAALAVWQGTNAKTPSVGLGDGPYLLAGGTPGTTLPVALYDASGNGISPSAQQLATADLFPLLPGKGTITAADGTTGYGAINSSSYSLVGGANLGSADPSALQPLSVFTVASNTTHKGDVVITGDTSVPTRLPGFSNTVTAHLPTYVRTGTGSITVAAARDLYLKDPTGADALSLGVIYSAGRDSLPTAYTVQSTTNSTGPTVTYMAPAPLQGSDFQVPLLMACSANTGAAFCASDGPLTAAAYPRNGGNVTVVAQRDIVGSEGSGLKTANDQEFLAPWMVSQGTVLQNPVSGPYAVASTGGIYTPAQASWWINFGSFDQGVMSVGGDVRVTAGRDINQLSVSLPTTAWTSGGRSNASVPILHLDPSGDMDVSAGRDILSGFYYEGSGTGRITAGGKVASDFTADTSQGTTTSAPIHMSTLLALDTGTIAVTARDSIDIAGIVSGASMQRVDRTATGGSAVFLSSYGPGSAVTLTSTAGNVVANSLPQPYVLAHGSQSVSAGPTPPVFGLYPASFEAAALLGDVTIASGFQMAPSNSGTLALLAQGSLTTIETDVKPVSPGQLSLLNVMSAGPSLVEQSFDPSRPAAGFADPTGAVSDLGPESLHQGDPLPDLFYAVNGNIVSLPTVTSTAAIPTPPMAWEVDKPATIHAGRDIIDLPFFGQNLAPGDVTSVIASRDITYTGNSEPNVAKVFFATAGVALSGQMDAGAIQAGLSLAGPGFFDIEAGRNLGPFVTPGADASAAKGSGSADPIGNGIITFGNTYTVGNRLMFENTSGGTLPSTNPFGSAPDFLLPRNGASIIVNFGVGKGINYQGVIDAYLNPSPPPGVIPGANNYLPQLAAFLQTLGPNAPAGDPWTAFQNLPLALQHVFVDRIFAAELASAEAKAAAKDPTGIPEGYAVIAALFPARLGYTDNGTGGPTAASRAATGDLDMLHATIKTTLGGDVSILGPGGGMNIGSTAAEIDTKLTLSAIGILTLDGGTINTFTDGNVFVDQSRVLTILGGDVDMWSSNADLDAGRGKRTTADFKPLTVNFSPSDYQTVNANGLVTGAGIGTIRGTPATPQGQVNLAAPRGTINFGAAGVRSTGNLNVVALSIVNAANASVSGSTTGVPQAVSVNLGALESASSAAGGATQAAQNAAAAASNRNAAPAQSLPSQISVQVLGYGACDASCAGAAPAP